MLEGSDRVGRQAATGDRRRRDARRGCRGDAGPASGGDRAGRARGSGTRSCTRTPSRRPSGRGSAAADAAAPSWASRPTSTPDGVRHRRAAAGLASGARCRTSDVSVAEYVRERASARRCSSGWWNPCSAASTPGTPTRCRWLPPGAADAGSGRRPAGGAAATVATPEGGPVFAGLDGGLGQLPDGARWRRPDAEVRTQTPWSETSSESGAAWLITLDGGQEKRRRGRRGDPGPGGRAAARRAWRPRRPSSSPTSTYASMAIVTFVFDDDVELTGSGFLVPPVDGTADQGCHVLVAEVGVARGVRPHRAPRFRRAGRRHRAAASGRRHRGRRRARRPPQRARARCRSRRQWHVQRWGGALAAVRGRPPRAHSTRSSRARDAERGWRCAARPIAGWAIPAVIASAQAAVQRLLADLGH